MATLPHQLRHVANGRGLWKTLNSLPMPRKAKESIARSVKFLVNPADVSARRKLGQPEIADTTLYTALEQNGFVQTISFLTKEAAAAALELKAEFARLNPSLLLPKSGSKKGSFLVTVLQDKQFLDLPKTCSLVVNPLLVATATRYLGEAPVLSSIVLWWSPVNNTAQSSQLFHFDEEDDRQLKFFLNVDDVTLANGPFTLISAEDSLRVASARGSKHGRFKDDEVNAIVGTKEHRSFTGQSGNLAAVDTSRCLHYGSRGNSEERLVLMFQFTKATAPLGQVPIWGDKIIPMLSSFNALQRRLFYFP